MTSFLKPTGPTFLPPDPRISEPSRVDTQTVVRVGMLAALALIAFTVLLLRLWALQIISGDTYQARADSLRLRTERIQAQRGPILDRNGRQFVKNRVSNTIEVWPGELPRRGDKPNRWTVLKRLGPLVGVSPLKIAREVDARRGQPLDPVVVKQDISLDLKSYLEERDREFPGVDIGSRYVRTYPRGSLAAHVLGHIGEASPTQLSRNADLRSGDVVGRDGVELAFDRYLRGTPGLEQLTVDASGNAESVRQTVQQAQPGYAVRLTLDMNLQRSAEEALNYGIALARGSNCAGCWSSNGGAIIAMDPRDGSILAEASYPTYPPRVFSGQVSQRTLEHWGLAGNSARALNYPAINRSTWGRYPPGSTFKPITALAGLKLGFAGTRHCTGQLEVKSEIPGLPSQIFRNWDPNVSRWMDLPTALATSCDTYFYGVGQDIYGLSADQGSPLQDWARRFGLGQHTGIDAGGDDAGLLPTPEWKKQHFSSEQDQAWTTGDSIQLAIGQKDIVATPLQMARMYAAIANGGWLVTPHVFLRAEQGDAVVSHEGAPPRTQIDGLQPEAVGIVQDGLYRAVHSSEGTSYPVFGNFPISIAGKTGTAERYSEELGQMVDQSWWCGYGPSDAARIVVCAVIENGGHGGTAAAPAAARVFEQFFGLDQGQVSGSIHSD